MNLKELVPPLEVCREIAEWRFDKSALVYAKTWADPEPFVAPREAAIENQWEIHASAPTMFEIYAEIGEHVKMIICPSSSYPGKWYVTISWPLEDGLTMMTGGMDENPATAALGCYYAKKKSKVV